MTYLTLIVISIDELGPITRYFGVRRSCVFLGSVQRDLDILNVRIEDGVEVSW